MFFIKYQTVWGEGRVLLSLFDVAGGREREREKETIRQTDKQTERKSEIKRNRPKERQMKRQRDRQIAMERHRPFPMISRSR